MEVNVDTSKSCKNIYIYNVMPRTTTKKYVKRNT